MDALRYGASWPGGREMTEPKRIALYARVSDPRDGRQHPEIQLGELREYAEQRRWKIEHEFIDHISGSKDSGRDWVVVPQYGRGEIGA